MLTAEDLDNIEARMTKVVAKALGKDATAPTPETPQLPVREILPGEEDALRAAFDGIRPEQFLAWRNVADSAEYIRSALTRFGVELVTQLPDQVQSGSLPLMVRYAGPFPFGPADPLPGDVYGAGV